MDFLVCFFVGVFFFIFINQSWERLRYSAHQDNGFFFPSSFMTGARTLIAYHTGICFLSATYIQIKTSRKYIYLRIFSEIIISNYYLKITIFNDEVFQIPHYAKPSSKVLIGLPLRWGGQLEYQDWFGEAPSTYNWASPREYRTSDRPTQHNAGWTLKSEAKTDAAFKPGLHPFS